MKKNDYEHSRPLDEDKWSEQKEEIIGTLSFTVKNVPVME